MNTDLILCIIALSAIISPVAVAFMNNKHDYAIKKLELITKTKQEILSNFANQVLSNWPTNEIVAINFYKSLNILYAYFDINDQLLDKIINSKGKNIYEYQKDIADFMKDLSKQINNK